MSPTSPASPSSRAAASQAAANLMYVRQLTIEAPPERVFGAIGTLDGPRHW